MLNFFRKKQRKKKKTTILGESNIYISEQHQQKEICFSETQLMIFTHSHAFIPLLLTL